MHTVMKHEFSIVCDEVRAETTGKLILVGVYPHNTLGIALPANIGVLSFYQVLTSDQSGSVPFQAELIRKRDQTVIQAVQATMNIAASGAVIGMLSFRNVEFKEPGPYVLDLVFQNQRLSTAEFTIIDQSSDKLSPPPPRRSRSSSR